MLGWGEGVDSGFLESALRMQTGVMNLNFLQTDACEHTVLPIDREIKA